MPTEVIQNFRYGLDTRRSEYTSALGTLVTLRNAFINQGAEIEQRKAFQAIDLTPTPASGVGNLLGAEPLASSIVLFGGEANADPNWPPSGFTYQQLVRNPAALTDGAACDVVGPPSYCTDCVDFATSKKATSVIHSTVFSGKAWVLAGMEDGTICAFYDGVAVADINYAGAILPGMDSLLKLYCAMVLAFEGSEAYTVDINDDGDGIVVTGNPGREFSIAVEATGTLEDTPPVATFLSGTTPAIPGKVASGFFTIQDGVPRGSVNRIVSVKVVTPSGTESKLLTVDGGGTEIPVNFTSDPERTAALVVESINNAGTPYNAKNLGGIVTIYADDIGTSDNGKRIKVEVEGQVLIGHCSLVFNGTGFQTDYIKVDGANILYLLANPSFPTGSESLTNYVARLATNINDNTLIGAAHGYVAIARQNVLKFSKRITISDAAATGTDDQPADRGMLPVEVSISSTGGTGEVTEGNSASLTAKIDLSEVLIKFTARGGIRTPDFTGVIGVTEDEVRCLVTGGTPPYKLLWRVDQESNTALVITNPSLSSTHIRDVSTVRTISDLYAKSALLYLDVEDANGNKVTSIPVPVRAGWSF